MDYFDASKVINFRLIRFPCIVAAWKLENEASGFEAMVCNVYLFFQEF